MELQIEESLFAAFVVARKWDRYRALIGTAKGRDKLRQSLAHFDDWDSRFIHRVDGDPQAVYEALSKRGALRECYVVSEDRRFDASRMDLLEALKATIGNGMGTVISCVPGRLAFYEGEGPRDRFILDRPKAADK
ncbi:MAG TPA: hypothetical protein VMB85_26855 [Bryobacteraceae bacterium]|nr:hypothetical protein [Bryobacteraceae bacterium]